VLLPARKRGQAASSSPKARVALVAVTALVSLAVLAPSVSRLAQYGPPITQDGWDQYPEAGPEGRFDPADRPPFEPLPLALLDPLEAALVGAETPLVPFTDVRDFAHWLCPLLFLLAAIGWAYQARQRAEALRLLVLPAAMLVCHTASLLLEPRLFLPERHVAYAMPVSALVAVPGALRGLAHSGWARGRALGAAYGVLLLALLGAHGSGWTGVTVRVSPEKQPLYAALARLPEDSLIAGWPSETTDSIPYLSRRSVLVAWETHMPFHTAFTEQMRARMRALTEAYLATTPEPVYSLRERYGVTHLLVNRRHFEVPPAYFAPFEDEARARFERGRTLGFFLEDQMPVLTHGDLVLFDLSRI
jgi:hypothetical protein